jgi:hypothetical protein
MEGTGAVAMPRRAKNIDMKNPPWNIKNIYMRTTPDFHKKNIFHIKRIYTFII